MKQIGLIVFLMFTLSLPLYAQYDILSFQPISSVLVYRDRLFIFDIDGDGIDELVAAEDSEIRILDIFTGEIIWECQSFAGIISDVEIVDIEPDGDLDMIVGSIEPYYRHFYIVYDMDTNNIYEWPEAMPGTCRAFHLQRIDGIPYLFMKSFGLLKMNLLEMTYDYYPEFDQYGFAVFTDSTIYGAHRYEDGAGQYCYAFIMDYDFNLLVYQELLSCEFVSYPSCPGIFSDYNEDPGTELIYGASCLDDEDIDYFNMYIRNSDLMQIEYYDYTWLARPSYFVAANVIGDEYDELLIRCSLADNPSVFMNALFEGKGDLLAVTQPGDFIYTGYTCNVDDDPYDELISSEGNMIYTYDVEVITVDVEQPEIIPCKISSIVYPNPFNNATLINYDLPAQAEVSLEIYDILGRKIETLIKCAQPAGHHQAAWRASDLPSGVYFYKLTIGESSKTEKMVLVK